VAAVGESWPLLAAIGTVSDDRVEGQELAKVAYLFEENAAKVWRKRLGVEPKDDVQMVGLI
jgi:hypothetical protein